MFSTTINDACEEGMERGCEMICDSETCDSCCNITSIAFGTISGVITGAILGSLYASAQPEDKRLIVITAVDQLTKAFNCTVEGALPSNLHSITVKCDSLVVQDEVQKQVDDIADAELGTNLAMVGKVLAGLVGGAILGGVAGFTCTFFAAKTKDNCIAALDNCIARKREDAAREAMEQGYRENLSANKRAN